jgi:hypothetical protein
LPWPPSRGSGKCVEGLEAGEAGQDPDQPAGLGQAQVGEQTIHEHFDDASPPAVTLLDHCANLRLESSQGPQSPHRRPIEVPKPGEAADDTGDRLDWIGPGKRRFDVFKTPAHSKRVTDPFQETTFELNC